METLSRSAVGILAPLAALTALTGLVGCGGSDAAGAAAAPSCDAVPTAAVRAALGVDVGPPARGGTDGTAVCTFTTTETTPRTIIVRLQRGVDAQAFAATRDGFTSTGQQAKDLPGFFDAAFTSVLVAQKISTTTLVVLRGTDEVLVTSPGTVEQERALVTAVLAALR